MHALGGSCPTRWICLSTNTPRPRGKRARCPKEHRSQHGHSTVTARSLPLPLPLPLPLSHGAGASRTHVGHGSPCIKRSKPSPDQAQSSVETSPSQAQVKNRLHEVAAVGDQGVAVRPGARVGRRSGSAAVVADAAGVRRVGIQPCPRQRPGWRHSSGVHATINPHPGCKIARCMRMAARRARRTAHGVGGVASC